MVKGGRCLRQAAPAKRAAEVLALDHHLKSPGVFSASGGIVLANFANTIPIFVHPHGPVQDGGVAQGLLRLGAGQPVVGAAGYGAAADQA